MTDYTPTTEQVRDLYILADPAGCRSRREYEAEFNRWLQQVKAEAWDEGNAAGWTEATARQENVSTYPKLTITNPYRQEQA